MLGVPPVTVTGTVVLPVPPALSVTVRVTLKVPAVANVWDGFRLTSRAVPSLKFQLHAVTVPSASVLASVNAHAVPAIHAGAVKLAVGFVFGPVLLPLSLQPHAAARMTVVAAIRGIDRIESSQQRVTV